MLEQKKTNEEGKIKNINSRRAKTDIDASYMNRFDKKLFLNGDQNSVNYNYNVSYNYHPNLQNLTIESTYYKEN